MRCPKCGFISFDHLEKCLKCSKKIKSTSDKLQGSVYNVPTPVFLAFTTESTDTEIDQIDVFFEDEEAIESVDVKDSDLDILLEEEKDEGFAETEISLFSADEGAEITLDLPEDDAAEPDLDIVLENDTDEDMGGLSFEPEEPEEAESDLDELEESALADFGDNDPDDSISINLPDELSDISDLEAPFEEPAVAALSEPLPDEDGTDFEFDLDLGLDNTEPAAPEVPGQSFDDTPDPAETPKKPASTIVDMDEDLNFDLDLGGLSIHDD